MDLEIPTHHIKQEICDTRLPYRDGRHAKAVKVYTVNNESSYILIQGVPSVGAKEELLKLCKSFGPIEQFNALDDYPNSDKYTEVYLVKYRKILSARFAKRKLDDYSFFGGVLHVCYVPEYETVNETREKLQDRRRVIAAKLKQHDKKQWHHSNTEVVKRETQIVSSGKNEVKSFLSQIETANLYSDPKQFSPKKSSVYTEQSHPTEGTRQPEMTLDVFQLPAPPKERAKHFHRPIAKHTTPNLNTDTNIFSVKTGVRPDMAMPASNVSQQKQFQANGTHNSQIKTLPDGTKVIVHDKDNTKPTLKFVPRQTIKSLPVMKKSEKSIAKPPDSLDQEIKKNAFQLGEIQGPAEIVNRKRELPTTQKSVNETILAIRSKITKVIHQEIKKPDY